ncbi:MAG: cryptochrome/photolyase family protein [Hyphomicrobiales bacterium]
MTTLRFILGDQLSHDISSLSDAVPGIDKVLLCEVVEEASYVKHHKQKIAFLFSAMRHFALELSGRGFEVRYVKLNDRGNTGSFSGELQRAVAYFKTEQVVVTEPGEWRVLEEMRNWETNLGIGVEIREDSRFICSHSEFDDWADGRKQLRMEYFYRDMRRKTGFLMNGLEPEGLKWNFDKENRKTLPRNLKFPDRAVPEVDEITAEVLSLVDEQFPDHFGSLEGFSYPVTRDAALDVLREFIAKSFAHYGDYQDAMKEGEPNLFHSLISASMNAGLLDPLEACKAAEDAYRNGHAPLNAAEGFIRQIIGWREYVRGIYWLKMPNYAQMNFLNAKRSLPDFYWSGDTKMNCIKQVVGETRENAYAHHIQRLMITGNFALLYGVAPAQINEWYLAVYADAFEWVQLPNTHGMVMFADGGMLGSKPYAASGSYINKMSDYCKNCQYNYADKSGEEACPFNYLYWNFLIENQNQLNSNQRMAMMYATLNKMSVEKRNAISSDSNRFFEETRSQ